MAAKTNWYVITGGPSSGKTTLINHLASLGYSVVNETARALIDQGISNGKTLAEIRKDEFAFQKQVLKMKIDIESKLDKKQTTFLDRGIPDTIAYCNIYDQNPLFVVKASSKKRYQAVFLLEPVKFETDYARIEGLDFQLKIHDLLKKAYSDLSYQVIEVPVMPVEERARFVLRQVRV